MLFLLTVNTGRKNGPINQMPCFILLMYTDRPGLIRLGRSETTPIESGHRHLCQTDTDIWLFHKLSPLGPGNTKTKFSTFPRPDNEQATRRGITHFL